MTSNHVILYNRPEISTVENKGFHIAPLSISVHIGVIYTISLENDINRQF